MRSFNATSTTYFVYLLTQLQLQLHRYSTAQHSTASIHRSTVQHPYRQTYYIRSTFSFHLTLLLHYQPHHDIDTATAQGRQQQPTQRQQQQQQQYRRRPRADPPPNDEHTRPC